MGLTITTIVCAYNESRLPARPVSTPSGRRRGRPTRSWSSTTRAPTRRAPWRAPCPASAWSTSRPRGWWWRARPARRAAQTDIVAYIDADCRVPITWLERVEAHFLKPHAPVAVTGPYRFYDWDWSGRALIRAYDVLVAPPTHAVVHHVLGARRDPLRRQLRGPPRCARRDRRLRSPDRVSRRGHEPGPAPDAARPRRAVPGLLGLDLGAPLPRDGEGGGVQPLRAELLVGDPAPSAGRPHASGREGLSARIRAVSALRLSRPHQLERRPAVAARGRRSVRQDAALRRDRDHRSHPDEARSARARRPAAVARPPRVLGDRGALRRPTWTTSPPRRAARGSCTTCSSFPAPRSRRTTSAARRTRTSSR